MALRAVSEFRRSDGSFNMTPLIDIVFLLIIFFLVVCQFIEAENFPVAVPEVAGSAQSNEQTDQLATVTVIKDGDADIDFAVGAEIITGPDIVEQMAALIDSRFKSGGDVKRVVTVRMDKDVRFEQAKHALAAVAASSATDVQLAVIKEAGKK